MPVSPLITSPARATRSHSAPRSVRPARTRSTGSPARAGDGRGQVALAGGAGDEDRGPRSVERGGHGREPLDGPPLRPVGRAGVDEDRCTARRGVGPIRRVRRRAGGGRRRPPGSRPPPAARTTGPARAGARRRPRPRRGPPSPDPPPRSGTRSGGAGFSASSARWLCGPVPCRLTATSGAGPGHGTAVGSGVGSSGVDAADPVDQRRERRGRREHEPVLGVGPAQRPQGRNRDEQVADLQRAQGEKGGSPVVRHAAPVPAVSPPDPAALLRGCGRIGARCAQAVVAARSTGLIPRTLSAGTGPTRRRTTRRRRTSARAMIVPVCYRARPQGRNCRRTISSVSTSPLIVPGGIRSERRPRELTDDQPG